MNIEFEKLEATDSNGISAMSALATKIVREHFDPLIGKAQNDYMLNKFQTVEAISDQLVHGYRYFFVAKNGERIGFLAFFGKDEGMYISKFYLLKEYRGQGISKQMLHFVVEAAKADGFAEIILNVNRGNMAVKVYEHLGFDIKRCEVNDIGCGFVMDDYVMRYNIRTGCHTATRVIE